MTKIACVQSNVAFANPDENAKRADWHLQTLASQGVKLAVFPEAFLTGYCVSSDEEADKIALDVTQDWNGNLTSFPDSVLRIQESCKKNSIGAVVGLAGNNHVERYNGAILFGSDGSMRLYRKAHLPELGLDKFVSRGDALPVFDTEIGRIGILICFDMRPPEAARVLALKGAELIVLPTNWPEGAEISADHVCIARATENKVYMATCNRVGDENGFRFIGRSKIIDPYGNVLASAGETEEVITAEIDLALSRNKRNVTIPGKYETEVFASRRPELYGKLLER